MEGVKGEYCDVLGTGSVQLEDSNGTKHIIHDVLYAPDSKRALLSFAKLIQDHHFEIEFIKRFDPSNFHLTSAKSGLKLPGRTINKLFHVWEPKSAQVALITTRSMPAKRSHDDDVGDHERSERRSPDSQPIGMQEIEKFENSLQESSDIQPIRNQDSSPLHQQIQDQRNLHPTAKRTKHSVVRYAPYLVRIDPSISAFHLWHRRLGHTALRTLRMLGYITGTDKHQSFCKACAFAKQTRLPYRPY